MDFGTFRKNVDVNPREADPGDVVLQYRNVVGVTVTFELADAFERRRNGLFAYYLTVSDAYGRDITREFNHIYDNTDPVGSKSRVRSAAVDIVGEIIS